MKRIGILLLVAFLLSFCAQAQAPTPQQTLRQYVADLQHNPDDTALRDKIIELAKRMRPAPVVPQSAKAEFAKTAAQLKTASTANDFRAAAKTFEHVALQAPWYTDAYYNAASAYNRAAEYENAKRNLALYMAAVRSGTNIQAAEDLQRDIEAQQRELKRQQDLQRFEQALQEFRANPSDSAREHVIKLALSLPYRPEVPDNVHEAAGRAAYAVKSASSERGFAAAAEAYEKALQFAPWVPDYYYNQGVAYEHAKQFDKAIAAFGWYLMTAPDPKDASAARERIGGLKYAKERAEQERREAAQAEQRRQEEHARNCQQFEQDHNRGNQAYQARRYDEGIEFFNKALKDGCPDHREAGAPWAGLAATYADKGDYQEAAKIAQRGLDIYPDYPSLNGLMGNFLWHNGDRVGACRRWRKACGLGMQQGCNLVAQYGCR
jgi:tetratricopeptide (TPR) repeat protein